LLKEPIDEERIAAAIAARLASVTTNTAAQLASLTADSNNKLALSLEGLKGEVKAIKDKIGDYVPTACITHNEDMKNAVRRVSDVEDEVKRLWAEKAQLGAMNDLKTQVSEHVKEPLNAYQSFKLLAGAAFAGGALTAIITYALNHIH
jgi:VIT1/CCC1 family predicted Fe2+/Mn2+ transporter